MAHGTHDFSDDPRNGQILIWVNGELVPRDQAVVSVFDAGFVLDVGRSREELAEAIYATLAANDMTDGVHVRLMVTRGVKRTPYQDPRVTVGPPTVVIIAEYKQPAPATLERGVSL